MERGGGPDHGRDRIEHEIIGSTKIHFRGRLVMRWILTIMEMSWKIEDVRNAPE